MGVSTIYKSFNWLYFWAWKPSTSYYSLVIHDLLKKNECGVSVNGWSKNGSHCSKHFIIIIIIIYLMIACQWLDNHKNVGSAIRFVSWRWLAILFPQEKILFCSHSEVHVICIQMNTWIVACSFSVVSIIYCRESFYTSSNWSSVLIGWSLITKKKMKIIKLQTIGFNRWKLEACTEMMTWNQTNFVLLFRIVLSVWNELREVFFIHCNKKLIFKYVNANILQMCPEVPLWA